MRVWRGRGCPGIVGVIIACGDCHTPHGCVTPIRSANPRPRQTRACGSAVHAVTDVMTYGTCGALRHLLGKLA